MYSGLLYSLNLFNSTGQLALQRLEIVDLVLELGNAQLAIIKYLKALVTMRESLGSKLQSGFMNIGRGNQNRGALLSLLNLVFYFIFLELCRYFASILCFHICKQWNHIRLAAIHEAGTNNQKHQQYNTADGQITLFFSGFFPKLKVFFFPLAHYLNPFAVFCLILSSNYTCIRIIS